MLTEAQFQILYHLTAHKYTNQRILSETLGCSLGKTNSLLKAMREENWLSEEYTLTESGYAQLKPYKVDNAIIMAAGMSSRFAPLSYEKPKGTLVVKGEVLIERQIRQIQEAGILDITVVVGYMKEKFFYLQDKFGVDIVINEDYYRYNNTSTLIKVLDRLKNTYICSSDNYFVDNVFEKYVYDSYYSAVYFPGKTDEYGLKTDKKGVIKEVCYGAQDMWCMLGHAYFSKWFSKKFSEILVKEYDTGNTKKELWENLMARNLSQLKMYIRHYDADKVLEFDSLEELRAFDDRYLENSGSGIFRNICRVLHCEEADITDIEVIKQGLTNLSFHFRVKENAYVYRHPGPGTEKYISRESEAFSVSLAKKLGLDPTAIEISAKEGWKISRYLSNVRNMDYHNEREVRQALGMVKRLHDAAIVSPYDFDIWRRTENLIAKTGASHKDFEDFESLHQGMQKLYEYAKQDGGDWILCHCDCYDPNFLIDEEGAMVLIDWEYSGNDDPANDLGTFICCSDYTYEEALGIFEIYYGRKPEFKELRHNLAYVAIASYYWYVWAIYQESIGNTIGQYLFLWYRNAKEYRKRAVEMYEGGEAAWQKRILEN